MGSSQKPKKSDSATSNRYILDGGKDKLVQQERFVDQGDLIPVRSFFIFFDTISTTGLIFAVHKSSMPYLGSVIGELLKIRFPVNGEPDVEWMARVVGSAERNSGYWWDKGFDEGDTNEVLLTLKFEGMPEERIKTIHKVLRSKYRQVKAEKRKLSAEYFAKNLSRTMWRMFLYFCLAYALGSSAWWAIGEKVEKTFGSLNNLKNQVSHQKTQQYEYIDSIAEMNRSVNGVKPSDFVRHIDQKQTKEIQKMAKKLNAKELKRIKHALEVSIENHRQALVELDFSSNDRPTRIPANAPKAPTKKSK